MLIPPGDVCEQQNAEDVYVSLYIGGQYLVNYLIRVSNKLE